MSKLKNARRSFPAVPALLAVHAALVGYSAWVHAPVMDELGHLAAGLSHWQLGRFGLYKVNPPLVRMVAALPVLAADPTTAWGGYFEGPGARPEFNVGDDFVRANGSRSFRLFTLARWGAIPLSLLGAWVCYIWARELNGYASGVAALTLWCFSPNILAYAAIITPDAGATALGVTANYLFWKWLRQPTPTRALAAGAVLGLAELSKTTWLVLFALWPMVACAWWLSDWWAPLRGVLGRLRSASTRTRGASKESSTRGLACAAGWCRRPELLRIRLRAAAQLATIMLLAIYVINLGYGFEGTGRRLRDFTFVSRLFAGANAGAERMPGIGNRFAKSWLGAVPVPLPANYVAGIDLQRRDFERGMPSYLCGEWRPRGWWYYYLYALAIKVPLGTWALVLLAAIARLRRRGELVGWRDELVLLAPFAAVLALVSSQTGISRYLRYVLPIAPYAFIWVSGVFRDSRWSSPYSHALPTRCAGAPNTSSAAPQASKDPMPLESRTRSVRGAVPTRSVGTSKPLGRCAPFDPVMSILGVAALVWSVASSLWYYPHSMSYFNEVVGGPRGGHAHLIDANIDWGQDLLYLKRWLEDHPEARPLRLAYFGLVDPGLAGIEFALPPKGLFVGQGLQARSTRPADLPPGWYAVSVNFLHGYAHRVPNGHGGNDFAEQGCYSYFLDMEPVTTVGYSIYIYQVGP